MAYHRVENSGTSAHFGADLEDRTPGLGGFDYLFLNSDHHIGSIAVGAMSSDGAGRANSDTYRLGFNDHDGGVFGRDSDPVRMSTKYADLGPHPTFTVSGRGSGRSVTRSWSKPLTYPLPMINARTRSTDSSNTW